MKFISPYSHSRIVIRRPQAAFKSVPSVNQSMSMLHSPLINEGKLSARELLDVQPQLSMQQNVGIGLVSASAFLFLTRISPAILSATSSILVCIVLAWALRHWALEAQWQALMENADDCGDKDSLFSLIQASDLQHSGSESIKVHYKAAHSSQTHSSLLLHCHHGFGSTCLSFEPFFTFLQKEDCPLSATSATAHDCTGFGLTERVKELDLYSLDVSGRIGSLISESNFHSSSTRAKPGPFLLCSDLDGTMVGVDDEGTRLFKEQWDTYIRSTGSKLVFSTGRSFDSVLDLIREKSSSLATPDALICWVGARIFCPSEKGGWEEDENWSRSLDIHWDDKALKNAVDRVISQANAHPSASSLPFTADYRPIEDQLKHKCSLAIHVVLLDDALASLNADLDQAGVKRNIIVSFHGELRVLDIVPIGGGKKNAMAYVSQILGFSPEKTVAAGDSANDILMLEGSQYSIAVGNSQPDLLQWISERGKRNGPSPILITRSKEARGVLEGLSHHGFTLDPPKRINLGHSVGSISAAKEAIRLQREGQGLDALILIAPAIFSSEPLGRLAKGILSIVSLSVVFFLRVSRPLLVLVLRSLVRSKSFWVNALSAAYQDPSKLTSRMVENYRLASMVKGWEVGLCRFIESRVTPSNDPDLVSDLSSLKCPVLIVHGSRDKLVSLGNSVKLSERLKCRLEIIEDCGHCPQEERTEEFINALASFIRTKQ